MPNVFVTIQTIVGIQGDGRWIAAALLIAGIARGIRHLPATRHAAVNADISAQPPAVPVIAGVVVRKDVPIYLDGIGTVP
jgi:hypothetical protein